METYKFINTVTLTGFAYPSKESVTHTFNIGDEIEGNYIAGSNPNTGGAASTMNSVKFTWTQQSANAKSMPITFIALAKDVQAFTVSTTKYYNATVQVAKYGYKVGDALKVKVVSENHSDGYVGGAAPSVSTVDKDNEYWSVFYGDVPVPNFVLELKLGTEIPASEIENKGGDTAPTTTTNNDVYIYSGIGALSGLVLYNFGWDYAAKHLKFGAKFAAKSNLGYVIAVAAGLGIGYGIYYLKSKNDAKGGATSTTPASSTLTQAQADAIATNISGLLRNCASMAYTQEVQSAQTVAANKAQADILLKQLKDAGYAMDSTNCKAQYIPKPV